MTIKECIDIVDNAKPNQYGIKEKVMWLSFVDETIINDVLKTHEGYDGRYDNFEGYTEDKLSVPLIVPSPYDRLYPQYLKMMIDSENGETARYNNSSALYNTYLNEYKKYYNKTHMPLNVTQKIPSPVSININSALSEAQIENIKRQLYYMLSQDVGEVISHDKLYDIAMEYYQNNTEVLKGKDGKSGAMIYSFPFAEWNTGEEYHINFDWENQYNKDDHPGADNWKKGDIVITKNGKIAEITNVIRHSAERWLVDFRCFADIMGKDGENGTTIHTVNFGLSKVNPVGVRYSNYFRGAGIYLDFTMPKGFVEGDLLFDGGSGLMFNHSTASYSTTEHGETIMVTYDVITVIANLNGKDGKDGKDCTLPEGNMVSMGEVDMLPVVAKEGEVYKVVSASVEKGEQVGTYNGIAGCAAITPNSIWGYANGADFVSAVRNAYFEISERPAPVVVESDGNTYHILVSGYHYEDSPIGTIDFIDGVTNVNTEISFDNAIVYKGILKKTVKMFGYFGGEWVELTNSGSDAGADDDAGLAGETLTKTKVKIYPFSGLSNYDENVYSDGFVTADYVPDGTETYIFEPSRAIAPYFISATFEPADYSGSGVTDSIAYTIYCSKALDGVSEYGTLTILK